MENNWARIYIAGFVDGEGSIGIQKYNRYNKPYDNYGIYIQISNTNKEVLTWIQVKYSGCLTKVKRKKLNHKQCWNLTIRHRKALEFLRDIEPYLIIKKHLAEIAIRIAERCQTMKYDHKQPKSMERQVLDNLDYEIFREVFNAGYVQEA